MVKVSGMLYRTIFISTRNSSWLSSAPPRTPSRMDAVPTIMVSRNNTRNRCFFSIPSTQKSPNSRFLCFMTKELM